MTPSLGPLVQSYFIDHLPVQKGLRVGSIRSYSDTIRLFLCFVSGQRRSSISALTLHDLTFERVLAFLRHLEQERGNSVSHAQSASSRAEYLLRLPRGAGARDARSLPTSCGDPGQADLAARYPLPRARGGDRIVSRFATGQPLRAARPHATALSVQHRRPGPGSR